MDDQQKQLVADILRVLESHNIHTTKIFLHKFIYFLTIQGIPGFIVQVIVCSVVCNLLFLVCYCRTKAFGYVWMQFQNLVKMLFRKYISKS